MWTTEHSIETTATREDVWAAWADVARWAEWNGDIEHVELSGPFAAGSTISMTPIGQEAVTLRIARADEPEVFVDEADVDGTVIRTIHRVDRVDGDRVRIVYRMEATGPLAETLGPAISGDFPDTITALAQRVQR